MGSPIFVPASFPESIFQLSGDQNPLHLNVEYARSTPYGACIAHGVGVFLLALGQWLEGRAFCFDHLRLRFLRPLRCGQDVEVESSSQEDSFHLLVKNHRAEILRAHLRGHFEPQNFDWSPWRSRNGMGDVLRAVPPLEFTEGHFSSTLGWNPRQLPAHQLFFLLWSSFLVGMHYPGPQALFGDLQVEFEPMATGDSIEFKVHHEDRFSLIRVSGQGSGIKNFQLTALERPRTQEPSLPWIEKKGEKLRAAFGGRKTLLTGGSRGLGQALRHLLLAAGSEVVSVQRSGASLGPKDKVLHQDLASAWNPEILRHLHEVAPSVDQVILSARGPAEVLKLSETSFEPFIKGFGQEFQTEFGLLFEILPLLKKGCRIVMLSTSFLEKEFPKGLAAYLAEKGAGEALMRGLSLEYPALDWQIRRCPPASTGMNLYPNHPVPIQKTDEVAFQILESLAKGAEPHPGHVNLVSLG